MNDPTRTGYRTGWLLPAALLLASVAAFPALAIGTNEQCATVSADKSFPDGRPHVWQSARTYGSAGCTNGYVVDVTYSALAPLPGTYASWGDGEPATEAECRGSWLRMFVWDVSSSQPTLVGSVTSQGAWIDNDDPVHNPGAAKVCHVPPLRFESAFTPANGRKYRLALRAETSGQNRGLVLANGPVPSRKGGNAEGGSEGMFLALPASGGGSDVTGWPIAPFAVKLTSPDRRVSRGGDLLHEGGFFERTAYGYVNPRSPNFGISNAMLLPQGNVGGLTDLNCPAFALTSTSRTYTYSAGMDSLSTAAGSRYCLLSERNDRVFRLKVWKTDPARTLLLVGYLPAGETGRWAWGCLDGLCGDGVGLVTQYTMPTAAERNDFAGTAHGFLRSTRSCLDAYLGRPLPVPLSMAVHGENATAAPSLSHNYGLGGAVVTTSGYEGLIRPGQTRVTDPLDLRYELHEPMHVYNHWFFADSLPSWLDEGFAEQAEGRVDCGGDPRLMMMGWRAWKPGDTDGHTVGSELFRRLEVNHGCGAPCAAQLWRDLVDAHGDDLSLTNAEVKDVFEKRMGTSLAPIFDVVGIDYRRTWMLPSSARIAGQGGSFYTTDLSIANPTAADASVTVQFLGHDGDGTGGAERTLTVGAGQTVAHEDVLGGLFGIGSGYGAIRVRSAARLVVAGQTWTPGPSGGTFGQSVPAMEDDDLVDGARPNTIVAVREDARFRTNLVLANASPTSLLANVALRDAGGAQLASKSYTLPPLGMTQVTQVVRDLGVTGDVQNGVLLVTTARTDASFSTYASVIDRTTNDPRTLLPAVVGEGGSWILPSSARAAGQGGAFYTTRLTLANRTDRDATVTLTFLGHDADGRGGPQKSVSLAAGKAMTWEDVLGGVFGVSSGYGAIRVSSPDVPLVVAGETSTPGPAGGTFGQSVPASGPADLVESGTPRSITGVREDARFRTNLILANATESALVVEAKLTSGAGTQLAAGSWTLPPLGMTQVTQVVRALGVAADLKDGRLVLSTPTAGGKFACYAAAIDRTTNDPRTLLPR